MEKRTILYAVAGFGISAGALLGVTYLWKTRQQPLESVNLPQLWLEEAKWSEKYRELESRSRVAADHGDVTQELQLRSQSLPLWDMSVRADLQALKTAKSLVSLDSHRLVVDGPTHLRLRVVDAFLTRQERHKRHSRVELVVVTSPTFSSTRRDKNTDLVLQLLINKQYIFREVEENIVWVYLKHAFSDSQPSCSIQ